MSRVLVVEDEEHLALGLRFNLENAGHEVRLASTGEAALSELERAGVDLIVLDVMLPGGMDGFAVARAVREAGNYAPIIMLTARDTLDDRVAGLNAGADDYVVKPFDLDELLARVRGALRRRAWTRRADGARPSGEAPELRFGRCRVDFQTMRAVTHDGHEVQLSPKEAMVMRLFAEREGEVISRATFLEEVWGEPGTLETRTVDNFILRLRKYFEETPRRPLHILSVRGAGYRFVR